jgi:hypothetical protein
VLNKKLFGRSWLEEMKRNVIRAVLVGVTAAIALAIPFFSLLTGLSGVFGNNLLGVILPPIIYVRLQHQCGYWRHIRTKHLFIHMQRLAWLRLLEFCFCVALVLFGIAMGGLGIQAFIREIIAKY